MSYEIICGYKGSAEWVAHSGGHFYVACRTTGRKTKYRCGTEDCAASFIATGGVAGPLAGHHHHEPELWIINRNLMFGALKRRCIEESTALQTIYEEEAIRYEDAAPHLLYSKVIGSMRKWRRNSQPALPRSVADYGAALAARPGNNIYLATVSAGGANAVIFTMTGWAQCLEAADTVVIDGTFKTVPAGMRAAQLLTVHAIVGSATYHPAMALMENRRQPLYEAVFERLWRDVGQPSGALQFVSDFEPALQTALARVTGHPVSGCYFHHLQALTRKARQCGLRVRRNSPGGRLVRMYGALALLPPAHVPPALAVLRATAEAEGLPYNETFHSYYTRYWMTQIGPETFTVAGRPHRTSNVAESFHAYLRRMLGASPNIWRFTQIIRQKFATCVARRQAQLAGVVPTPRRSRVRSLVRHNMAQDNVSAFERHRITAQQFLIATSRAVDLATLGFDDQFPVPDMGMEVVIEDDGAIAPAPGPVMHEGLLHDENLPHEEDLHAENGDYVENILQEEDFQHNLQQVRAPDVLDEPVLPPAGVAPPLPLAPPAPTTAPLCNICYENCVQRVFFPCGHCVCNDCVRGIENSNTPDRCAFCRAVIVQCIAIYF